MFQLPIHKNPLRTRSDVERALLQLVEPTLPFFSEGNTGLALGYFAAHYGTNSARLEAYSRLLWGLAPYWVNQREESLFPLFRAGLVNGTNPAHPEYWGDTFDYDQKLVEMAAIALFLHLHAGRLNLTQAEGERIHRWLGSINGRDMPPNNWSFFRVLVNTVFRGLGWPYDAGEMARDFALIERCYVADGWYTDGETDQIDYYIPFAMHYYGLIYAVMAQDDDPARAQQYRQRAADFAPAFLHWFTDAGQAVPFGRSLTYRFAQSAFFAALGWAGVEAVPWGVMKSRVLGNLRDWFSRPMFTADGLLTVGYAYPNLCMSENYNAPGSAYWSLKTFLCLAMDEEHPFWTAEEAVPQLAPYCAIEPARMMLARDSRQVQMFVAGQACAQLGQCEQKYQKLVYSSAFGFSVSRGDSLEEGAFDNCLAVSLAGENRYRMQRGFTAYSLTKTGFRRSFSPMQGVEVTVEVEVDFPSHQRHYTITTDRPIDVADGGFAISAEGEGALYREDMVHSTPGAVVADFPWGYSGISCENPSAKAVLVKAYPNTNVLAPLTRIPTICLRLEAGTHQVSTTVTGKI